MNPDWWRARLEREVAKHLSIPDLAKFMAFVDLDGAYPVVNAGTMGAFVFFSPEDPDLVPNVPTFRFPDERTAKEAIGRLKELWMRQSDKGVKVPRIPEIDDYIDYHLVDD